MSTLQEFLPLIFVIAFVVFSIRNGMNKKKQEEMEKTTLPGRRSISVVPVEAADAKQPVAAVASNPRPATHAAPNPLRAATPSEKENEEEPSTPLLNTEDPDELKKAILYTEIFNRKVY
jgi:hypothetical protein